MTLPPTSRRVAIVGAGAIGCRIGACLARTGSEVTLYDGWSDHVDAVSRDGLVLQEGGATSRHAMRAFRDDAVRAEDAGTFDWVLLAARSDDTARLAPLVQQLLSPRGVAVSCQNGINEEELAQAVGAERTLGCSMIFGAKLTAPGVVAAIPGPDTLRIGAYVPAGSRHVAALDALFAPCGEVSTTDNLMGYRWTKLSLNCMGNPLLLLSGLTGEALHADPAHRRAMIGIAGEVMRAALADGAQPEPVLGHAATDWTRSDALDDPRLHDALAAHGRDLGARRLSMVADFEARGRTEVRHLNGFVVRKSARHGLRAPLNQWVEQQVVALEGGDRSILTGGLAGLHAMTQGDKT